MSSAAALALLASGLAAITGPGRAAASPPVVPTYSTSTQNLPFETITTVDLHGDDAVSPVDLPFPVPFYGTTYNRAWVDTNGQVAFADQGRSFPDEELEALPSTSTPNATAYVFGDDLVVGPGSVVRTAVSGVAPNRTFLIEWSNVHRRQDWTDRFSAEAVFAENGDIRFAYDGLGTDADKRGAHAVVGLEDAAGTAATQVLYHEAQLDSGRSLLFHPQGGGYTVTSQIAAYDGVSLLDLAGDDHVAPIALPFPVSFYGGTYTTAWVDTNGQISFADPGRSFPDEDLESLPSGSTPNGTVYVFGDDLAVVDGSAVRTAVSGTAPNRRFLVEWHDVVRLDRPDERFSAEVVFAENGDITLNYADLDTPEEKGAAAVVGVENAAGNDAVQILYHQPTLSSGVATVLHPQNAPRPYVLSQETRPLDDLSTLDLSGDDAVAPVDLPFPFSFYGQTYTRAWVDTNGQLSFTDQGQAFPDEFLEPIPSTSTPNASVYVFGDDLVVGSGAVVRTAVSGTAPNRTFLVEWAGVSRFADRDNPFNAEVILAENGEITVNYSGLDTDGERGAGALVGVENAAGTAATQLLYHQAALQNGTATTFHPQGTPTASYTATTQARAYDGIGALDLRGDDDVTTVALPFPVTFYGQPYSTAWVDTNGQVDFVNPGRSFPDDDLEALPSSSTPNATVYAFGDDLEVGPGSVVRTRTGGVAPEREFVVQWHNVYRLDAPADRFTVEAAFRENGEIALNYRGLDTDAERGAHAVVGVENAAGSAATQVLFHEPLLSNGTAQVFVPQGSGPLHQAVFRGSDGVSATVRSQDPVGGYQINVHSDVDASLLAGQRQVSLAYDFSLDDGLSLEQADITIPYDPRRLGGADPQSLRIYHLDAKYGLWRLASAQQSVDPAAHTVTATVGHFSTYAVMAADPHGWESFWDTKPVWCVPSGAGPSSNLDIAFVVDQSGSMALNDPQGLRVDGAKGFVDAMRETDQAAVVGFTYSAAVYLGLTALSTPASVTAVKDALELTRPWGGGTDIGAAVSSGTATLMAGASAGRPRVVILLTDGESDYDPAVTEAARADDVVVYTIGLGDSIDDTLLRAIADGTGGRYLHLDQASQLPTLYAELARDLVDPGTDTDHDGLTDCIERRGALIAPGFYVPDSQVVTGTDVQSGRYVITDPNDPDTDNDGLSDGAEMGAALDLRDDAGLAQEYAFLVDAGITRLWNPHSDPRRGDSDGEGLQDAEEAYWHTNAFKKDTDGDRVNDYVEVQLGMDPTEADNSEIVNGPGYPDIAPRTLFLPDNNTYPWPGDIIGWDHVTHRCTSNCAEILAWSQAMSDGDAGQLPDFPQNIWCWFSGCLPSDYEKNFIEYAVDTQGVFNLDGSLSLRFRQDLFAEFCWEIYDRPTVDCTKSRIDGAALDNRSQWMDNLDTAEEIANILASLPGTVRRPLTQEQQATYDRLQQLANQACGSIPKTGMSDQKWGELVHNEFERLVQVERSTNPKLWGETGYLNHALANKTGSVRPKGSSWPDAVFGVSQLQPEMAFDLKTGVKGLVQKWLSRLSVNLPPAFNTIEVIKLICPKV